MNHGICTISAISGSQDGVVVAYINFQLSIIHPPRRTGFQLSTFNYQLSTSTMRIKFLLIALLFSATAFAQPDSACFTSGALLSVRHQVLKDSSEQIVFTFLETSPSFKSVSARPPFSEDPSDRPVHVKGQKFKEITFMSMSWVCTIPYSLRTITSSTKVRGFKNAGQFEGYFTYILGYRSGARVSGPVTRKYGKYSLVVFTVR